MSSYAPAFVMEVLFVLAESQSRTVDAGLWLHLEQGKTRKNPKFSGVKERRLDKTHCDSSLTASKLCKDVVLF